MSYELEQIRRQELGRAIKNQERMGIKEPLKLGFRPSGDDKIDSAMKKLFAAGKNGRDLWVMINKGLATVDRAKLLGMVGYPVAAVEELAKTEISNSRL
jgi:hypothetical protein